MTMKYFLKPLILALAAVLVFTACDGAYDSLVSSQKDENPLPEVSGDSGDADFSKYVAIGNSLTAGFMDSALYNLGQSNSLGAQMAHQLSYAGGSSTFNQPDINSVNGFNTAASNPAEGVIRGRFKLDPSIPGPSPVVAGELPETFTGDKSQLNNFAVPGIQVGQLLTPDTGNPNSPAFNPFYARFASAPGSSTILSDAIAANPTFFTLWIGSNDVLGYALSGGTNEAILTTAANFEQRFGAVVQSLMANTSAKGLVADIPPLLFAPFFQAVPYNVLPLNQEQVDQLNEGYTPYNNGLQLMVNISMMSQEEADRRHIHFEVGQNPFVMEDNTLTDRTSLGLPNIRQTEPTDIILLSAASLLPQGYGTAEPMPENHVLIPENIQLIEQSRQTFNAIIKNVVEQANTAENRIALYETNHPSSGFSELWGLDGSDAGLRVGGITLSPDFSPNGVFSTDGIHPNSRGVAFIVNDMISIIENEFNATIPEINALSLPGIQICAGDCVSQQPALIFDTDYSRIPIQ